MPKYFDIHSHLNFPDYEKDWDEVMQRLKDTDTHTIVVGTDYESSKRAVELAEKYEEIYACVGIHPTESRKHETLTDSHKFKAEKFDELARHPKTVAIGECGLDFFHQDKDLNYDRQRELFIDQVEFAVAYGKPVMIHSRNAYEEVLDILEPLDKKYGKKLFGNVHFFAGDLDTALRFINMGFTLSFTGVITFTKDYDEVIKFVALDMIMAETDAPYVTPVPYRGERNEPSYVSEVVKRIAEIRGEDFETVQKSLISNVERVFAISS